LLLYDGNASILRNPRRSVSVGREAVCFSGKFAKACDPDFVSLPVLEDLVRRVTHVAPLSVSGGLISSPNPNSRQPLRTDRRIDRCAGDAGMPQKLLDQPNINAIIDQGISSAMP
jgi:hypothetical protein